MALYRAISPGWVEDFLVGDVLGDGTLDLKYEITLVFEQNGTKAGRGFGVFFLGAGAGLWVLEVGTLLGVVAAAAL